MVVRAFIAALLAGMSGLLLLALSGWFLTAAAIAGAAGAAATFNYLLPSAAIRGFAIIRTASRYGERLWSHDAALTALAAMRARLFARLAGADTRTAPDLSTGEASSRLMTDIAVLEDLVVRRPALPAALLTMALGVVLAGLAGASAAAGAAATIGVTWVVIRHWRAPLMRGPAISVAEETEKLRRMILDHAAARAEIIAYGVAGRVTAQIEDQSRRLESARLRLIRAEALLVGIPTVSTGLAAALIVLLGRGAAPLVASALLAATVATVMLATFARSAARDAAIDDATARLGDLLALAPVSTATDPVEPKCLGIGNLKIEPGERLALTGPSGSGKTRLVEALAGMRPAVHDLTLDDTPLDRIDGGSIAAQVALAPQDPMLIVGSIGDNLRLARPGIDERAMIDVLTVAGLIDRVRQMPLGLDTPIGEGGGFLSGGERKRLSLARALLAGRPWLVLDEPTEGLDPTTEAAVVAALDVWLKETGTGLILVSHRPAPLALVRHRMAIGDIPMK